MSPGGRWIKVTVMAVEIFDDKDGPFDSTCELHIESRVALVTAQDDRLTEQRERIPKQGFFSLSSKPGMNRLLLEITVFDGALLDGGALELEFRAYDKDVLGSDEFSSFQRRLEGDAEDWRGNFTEQAEDWAIEFRVETGTFDATS